MIRLSKPQILLLHEQLLEATGGSFGLRDEGMLDSALNAPFQTFGEEDVYPSIQQKAARLCFGLVKNPPSWTEISTSALMPCWCSSL